MVTRVIAIPDKNGIVTISCGDDIIEIQVAPQGWAAGGGPSPGRNPFGDPFVSIIEDYFKDAPYILSLMATGNLDMSSIVKQVTDRIADADRDNPRAVVLDVNSVNLHDLSKLGQVIAASASDVSIAIDFGGGRKR